MTRPAAALLLTLILAGLIACGSEYDDRRSKSRNKRM